MKAHKGEASAFRTTVRDKAVNEKASILVRDAQLDDAFKGRMSIVEQKVHTMMAVPLQTKERIIGLIYVDSPFILREFTKDDLSLLTLMANMAAFRIENARLVGSGAGRAHHEARPLAGRGDSGRHAAGPAPDVPGVDLAGYNVACRTVGGDYYDFFTYPDGKVALALGDVSGKGMPASLMMMGLHARVHVLAEEPGNLGAFMARINKATCAKCPSNRFITFFFCVLDTVTGELRSPTRATIRRSSSAPMATRRCWKAAGRCSGILPIAPYSEMQARLNHGDMLVLYSDGVTEANNPAYEEFGEDRFIEVLQHHRDEPANADRAGGDDGAGRVRGRRAAGGRHHAGRGEETVVLTDLVQIGMLGEKKREENLRFRKHMKSHDHSDRILRRIAEGIEEQIDCTAVRELLPGGDREGR